MGAQNTTLPISSALITSVTNTTAVAPLVSVCTTECDLEDVVRSQLNPVNLSLNTSALKKCCIKNTCSSTRCESSNFRASCQVHTSTGWSTSRPDWSTDILTKHGSPIGNIIAEIKIISKPSNCMCGLVGPRFKKCPTCVSLCSSTPFSHVVPKKHHFVDAATGCNIDKPFGIFHPLATSSSPLTYFSNLAEGQIWHDIIRLKTAQNYFTLRGCPGYELYLILFCDNANGSFSSSQSNVHNVLQYFDRKKSNYLYHKGFTAGQTFRSDVPDFEYNLDVINPGTSGYGAFLVRIQ